MDFEFRFLILYFYCMYLFILYRFDSFSFYTFKIANFLKIDQTDFLSDKHNFSFKLMQLSLFQFYAENI